LFDVFTEQINDDDDDFGRYLTLESFRPIVCLLLLIVKCESHCCGLL